MNGISEAIVLDTNAIVDLLKDNAALEALERRFPGSAVCTSVISQIEVLGYPSITLEYETQIRDFLEDIIIIGIEDLIVEAAVDIRRFAPRVKLPDAVIAATALVFNAPLITRDNDLLGLTWPGLQTTNIT